MPTPEIEERTRIAKRIAREFNHSQQRMIINLGVGIPTMVANYIRSELVFIQAENGMLGVGRKAVENEIDPLLINAGREPVTQTPGCCYFDSAESFGMIRGGHVNATVIGAFQVDADGNIANWVIPNGRQLGVGGAMDLVSGAGQVIVAMIHRTGKGKPKIVRSCSLPVTGYGEADMIVTELAVFRFIDKKLTLVEIFPGVDLETLRRQTEADFEVSADLTEYLQ